MTPLAPIAITLLVAIGVAFLVWRQTGNGPLTLSAALLVLALASFALGTIATVALFWGGLLLFGSLVAFVISRVAGSVVR